MTASRLDACQPAKHCNQSAGSAQHVLSTSYFPHQTYTAIPQHVNMLDLLTLAGIPTAVGASEAVHRQQLLDEEAEAPERQAPFYIDVYCDAQSKKKDEVHNAIVVLKDGKASTTEHQHKAP